MVKGKICFARGPFNKNGLDGEQEMDFHQYSSYDRPGGTAIGIPVFDETDY